MKMNIKDQSLFRQQCYIDGQWVDADSGETLEVNNPSSGSVIGTVPKMGAAETERAVDAAELAFQSWRHRTAKERAAILRKLADLMMENQEDLAALMTIEQGKPLAESRGEVVYAASFFEWFAEEGKTTVWRCYTDSSSRSQNYRHQRARWSLRCNHALEFSFSDDYTKSRSGLGCRMHDCDQACGEHSLFGIGTLRIG